MSDLLLSKSTPPPSSLFSGVSVRNTGPDSRGKVNRTPGPPNDTCMCGLESIRALFPGLPPTWILTLVVEVGRWDRVESELKITAPERADD